MTSAFLENFSLSTLIAPLPEEQFLERYWEQTTLLLRRNDPNFYGDLFSLEDFDCAIASSPNYVKTADAKQTKNVKHAAETVTGLANILADMQNGGTLVLDALHQKHPKLGLLCRLLEQELSHKFQTNLYLTPPHGQGFTPHWDNHDVFILQVAGSKNWKIDKQRKAFPSRDENIDEKDRVHAADADAFTLSQGDLIYIPRGFIHSAECGSDPSLHITLGILPTTWADLLKATTTAIIKSDLHMHEALPLGFLKGNGDELVARTIASLKKAADEAHVRAAMDQFNDELTSQFRLDVSGQVMAFMQAAKLTGDDVVGPRRGIVFRLHHEGETVRINYGGKKIVFPDFLAQPLDYALNKARYAIRDIEGDLEESEKLVFVERLIQEGLVVHK